MVLFIKRHTIYSSEIFILSKMFSSRKLFKKL